MAVSAKHRGWLAKHQEGILAAVYNGAMPGTTAHGANTALDGVLLGTPVTPALAVDSLVISNLVASGDIALVANNGGNSQAWLVIDASVPSMTFYAAGVVEQTLTSTGVVFNEDSADKDFRVEGNGIEYAIYVDGGKDSVVLGSNTDTSSADNRVVISRAARTATANISYYDLYVAPAGAVTVPAGTTAVAASVAINEPNITATGTVTTAATLYLASQPTEGSANGALVVADNAWIGIGTDADQVLVNRSTILGATTALTGVILGTPVTPAIAANSLIISNITASGDILVAANLGGNSQAWLWVDSSAGTMTLYGAGTAVGVISAAALEIEDDILLALGNDQDVVLVNRSSILNANTALTGTLIGTPVTPAVAANSLILANATASGDILVAVNEGGNSQAYLWIDTSAAEMRLYGSGTLDVILTSGTVNIEDDILLGIGTGSTARFSYDTTDANSNQLLLQLPAAGATDSPVLIVGQSIESVDFGAAATGADYSAITDPRIALFSSGAVTTGPVLEFRKARGTTAAPTVVTTGDDLGTLDFYGAVANGEYVQAASIRADMAGTIATTQGPGTLTFLTATDASPSVLTAALTLGADQSATFGGVVVLPSGASINGTASITVNNNSADVDFIVESNDNANMLVVDAGENAIGIGAAAVASQTVTITNAAVAATGRVLKLSGTIAAAALTDGYGALEVDITLSGSPTAHSAASSSWINITGGTVPVGTYICANNDGIYEATAATITNAKLIFGSRMHKLTDDTDGLCFPFSLNTNNTAITAVFDCQNRSDFGLVAAAGTAENQLLPILRDAAGNVRYVMLYTN